MEDTDPATLQRLRPLNMYGYSKHLFDLHALRRGWLSRIVGLKYFNVYGPNEDHKGDMRSVVHKSFAQVRDEGCIRLFRSHRPDYRDGEQKRDFLYVKDAVAMTLHLAACPAASGLYNIGSGVAHTWIDLAEAIFAAMGMPPRIEFIDMPPELREKYQYFTLANIDRLRSTGYTDAVTPLRDAVRDYVVNHLRTGARLGDGPGQAT
jgi:ADP-L-glycero-D-manno-heptose 6-epimerase